MEYDFDDDELDYLAFDSLEESAWEDNAFYKEIKSAMPPGWSVVKLIGFTARTLVDSKEWLKSNCRGRYKIVGFNSYCAYNVAVQFERRSDMIYFKLRWV